MTVHLIEKHVLLQVERSEEVLKTEFFSYNQRNKPSRAQKDIFGTHSASFWNDSILLKKQNLFLKVFDITRHLKRRM